MAGLVWLEAADTLFGSRMFGNCIETYVVEAGGSNQFDT